MSFDPNSLSTSQFIRYLLTGSPTGGAANGGYGPNAFGSSGIDFANTLGQIAAGGTNGQIDPRLYQYFNVGSSGGENPVTTFSPTGAVSNQGTITIDGQPWIQLAGATDNTTIKNRDPSMFRNDPTYGELTPASNVMSGSDPFSDIAPWVMMAGIAGPALYGAATDAGLLGGTTGGTTGSTLGNVTQQVVGDLTPTTAGTPAAGTFDAEGVSGLGGVNALAPHTLGGQLAGLLSGAVSPMTALSGVGSSLLTGAMNNPLQALGLLQMGRGLIGSHGSTSTSGTSKSSGAGTGLPSPQSRPAWQANPFTAAAIQQLYGPGAK